MIVRTAAGLEVAQIGSSLAFDMGISFEVKPMYRRPVVALILVTLANAACGGGSAGGSGDTTKLTADSAGGLVEAPSEPYRETGAGSGALVVTLSADSAATPAPTCGSSEPETVFWIDGLREGKALPNERRYELKTAACGLEPRLMAAVVGGAVNVFSEAGVHTLVFVRAGTTDTLQTMPFSMSGSMVSTNRLTKIPGIIEAHCAQHPAEKAYIAVFDHPYFGIAANGSKVTLDAVPDGEYQVATWREGMSAPTLTPTRIGGATAAEVVVR